VVVSTA
jgi:hypothetical protein